MALTKLGSVKGVTQVLVTSVNLASEVTSILPVANGGTGQSTFTDGQILVGVTSGNTLAKVSLSGDISITNAGVTAIGSSKVTNAMLAGSIDLTTKVNGTLPVANGGTGITSLGTGVATWLGTPSSANLAAVITDETGSGLLVFGTRPTLKNPAETTQTLTDGTNIAWDLDNGGAATVTLGGNRTLSAPSNIRAGSTYYLIVKQDGTGSRTLAYNSAYKWPGGTAPTLTTTASATDILVFISDGTNMYGVAQKAFA